MNPSQSLKELLPSVREVADQVRQHVHTLQARITALQDERDALLKKGITREDYADLLCAEIDRKADAHCAAIAKNLSADLQSAIAGHKPAPGQAMAWIPTVVNARAASAQDRSVLRSGIRDRYGRDHDDVPLTQISATFLFREELKRTSREMVALIAPWPFVHAVGLKEATARLDAIAGELQRLGRELDDIRADAQAVGIDVASLFRPEPQPDAFEAVKGATQHMKRKAAEMLAETYARDHRLVITEELIEEYLLRIEAGEFAHLI